MSTPAESGWIELQASSREQCPKLFYHFQYVGHELTLHITDLMSIWRTTLNRQQVLSAAQEQDVSIDPSQSSSQYKVLINKLELSLKGGKNRLSRQTRNSSWCLVLDTKLRLPSPLRELQWRFILSPCHASELAEHILRPCLHNVSVYQDKIDSLLRIIKEKDHVMTRLLDRIDNSAIDLSLIFPSITGIKSRHKGHVPVSEAKKHIPGMAEFNPSDWEEAFVKQQQDDGYEDIKATGLNRLVSGCVKCFNHTRDEHERWIENLPGSEELEPSWKSFDSEKQGATKSQTKQAVVDSDDVTLSDDDFERQVTPPTLRESSVASDTKRPTSKSSNATTGSFRENERPAKRHKASRFGGLRRIDENESLGQDQDERPSTRDSLPSSPPQARRDSNASTNFASETDSDDLDAKPSQKSQSQAQSQFKPKAKSRDGETSDERKLGGLGSRNRLHRPSDSSTSSSPSPRQRKSSTPSISAPSKRLGSLPNRLSATPSKTKTGDKKENGDLSQSDSWTDRESPNKNQQKIPPRRLGRLRGSQMPSSPPARAPDTEMHDLDGDNGKHEADKGNVKGKANEQAEEDSTATETASEPDLGLDTKSTAKSRAKPPGGNHRNISPPIASNTRSTNRVKTEPHSSQAHAPAVSPVLAQYADRKQKEKEESLSPAAKANLRREALKKSLAGNGTDSSRAGTGAGFAPSSEVRAGPGVAANLRGKRKRRF